MKFARQLTIVLTLSLSVSLPAAGWTFRCRETLARWRNLFSPSLDTTKFKAFLASELEQIRPGAEKFLKALPPGSAIHVNEMEYTVIAFLGDGYEGTVYVADGPMGRKAVKQFKGTTNILVHLAELKRLGAAGVPTPKVWAVDEKNQTALLDYVEGLSVAQIRSRGPRFGLTPTEMTQFEAHLASFKLRVLPLWPKFKDQNIVMDFNTGEFFMIDPT